MCVRAPSGCITYRNITTGLIIPNTYKVVVSVYQMSHITKCKQTEIHRELPGLQARTVNSFHRENQSKFCRNIHNSVIVVSIILQAYN